jgi:calcineurin-like phosphoesterase family protein
MNRTIIERLNSLVKTNDILYFLGDFCIGPQARAVELRREIGCKKIYAVPGNHGNHSSHGAWHLYGHSHGRLPNLNASPSMDVGVDTHDSRPWHFDQIRDRMKERSASTAG